MNEFILYHGKFCPHCNNMMPILEQAEKEADVKFTKKEIYGNEENKEEFKTLRELANKNCGGLLIPSFYCKETNELICREHTLEELKEWIKKNK